jgi:hypothetical protein
MSATIKIFQVNNKSFSHVMNDNHDSVELRDDGNETLLTYGADATVSDQDGRRGNFFVEYVEGQPRWVYYEMPLQTRFVYGPDLRSAEVDVSRRFIGNAAVAVGYDLTPSPLELPTLYPPTLA